MAAVETLPAIDATTNKTRRPQRSKHPKPTATNATATSTHHHGPLRRPHPSDAPAPIKRYPHYPSDPRHSDRATENAEGQQDAELPLPPKDAYEHRHYRSYHPACNKLLAKRWEDHARDLHRTRLRLARSTIDDGAPKVYPHLEMRLKRNQSDEERLGDIERKNHILLNRIAFQMMNPAEVSNLKFIQNPELHKPAISAGLTPKRKRDMAKILAENLTILQRIEDKAPNYNRLEWLAARRRNLGYLLNIAQYPKTYVRLLDDGQAEFEILKVKERSSNRRSNNARKAEQEEAGDSVGEMPAGSTVRPTTRGAPKSAPLSDQGSSTTVDNAADASIDGSQQPVQRPPKHHAPARATDSLDDFDLGIVDDNHASDQADSPTGDENAAAAGSQATKTSRPSSGWSGFDQAEPSDRDADNQSESRLRDQDKEQASSPLSNRPIEAADSHEQPDGEHAADVDATAQTQGEEASGHDFFDNHEAGGEPPAAVEASDDPPKSAISTARPSPLPPIQPASRQGSEGARSRPLTARSSRSPRVGDEGEVGVVGLKELPPLQSGKSVPSSRPISAKIRPLSGPRGGSVSGSRTEPEQPAAAAVEAEQHQEPLTEQAHPLDDDFFNEIKTEDDGVDASAVEPAKHDEAAHIPPVEPERTDSDPIESEHVEPIVPGEAVDAVSVTNEPSPTAHSNGLVHAEHAVAESDVHSAQHDDTYANEAFEDEHHHSEAPAKQEIYEVIQDEQHVVEDHLALSYAIENETKRLEVLEVAKSDSATVAPSPMSLTEQVPAPDNQQVSPTAATGDHTRAPSDVGASPTQPDDKSPALSPAPAPEDVSTSIAPSPAPANDDARSMQPSPMPPASERGVSPTPPADAHAPEPATHEPAAQTAAVTEYHADIAAAQTAPATDHHFDIAAAQIAAVSEHHAEIAGAHADDHAGKQNDGGVVPIEDGYPIADAHNAVVTDSVEHPAAKAEHVQTEHVVHEQGGHENPAHEQPSTENPALVTADIEHVKQAEAAVDHANHVEPAIAPAVPQPRPPSKPASRLTSRAGSPRKASRVGSAAGAKQAEAAKASSKPISRAGSGREVRGAQ
ncbi:hypothetical protein HK101_010366 [Irineochytrium annulatum]|nr:hypothetical protein HK101_010366 [Irineochytrium annulatum]